MNLTTAIHAVGAIGIFPSRAFIPAFLTALLLRYGAEVPILANAPLLEMYIPAGETVPSWFTSDIALTLMGILAGLELLATKNTDLRQVLDEVDPYFKPVMAALTMYGVVSAADAEVVRSIRQAGLGENLLPLLTAFGVYAVGLLRQGVWLTLDEMDPDDAAGLQGILAWIEDLWSVFGLLLLLLLPVLMLILAALAVGMLWLVHARMAKAEARKKVPCASCGEAIHPCAPECPACHAAVAEPCDVGVFGQSKPETRADRAVLPYRLVEKLRCPVCATRLRSRRPKQVCTACGHRLNEEPAFVTGYDAFIAERAPGTYLVCLLLGFIPLVGIPPAIVYSRLHIVAPYGRYLPRGRSFLTRWGNRLALLLLAVLQIIPLVGSVMMPAAAFIGHHLYRGSWKGAVARASFPPPGAEDAPANLPEADEGRTPGATDPGDGPTAQT